MPQPNPLSSELPLLGYNHGGCTCGCSTSNSNIEQPLTNGKAAAVSTQEFSVTGMTCGHCVQAVTDELMSLDEVSDVSVALVPSGTSTVTLATTKNLDEGRIVSALDEAGDYHLASAT